jgi:uncharacterized SAM-binding protein YcdF (DUF218 family)
MPSQIVLFFFMAGALAWFMPRFRSWSTGFFAAALLIGIVFSSNKVAQSLLQPLERAYPAWTAEQSGLVDLENIVVLTAWSGKDASLTAGMLLNDSSAFRVLTAAALWRRQPSAHIIISGLPRVADDMADALVSLGVPRANITTERESGNTRESAIHCARLVAGTRFALVTSAGHMPRSMGLFARQGLDPLPVPTDYRLPGTWGGLAWLPSPRGLAASDLAVHEYLGLAWYRLRGWL